jgi:hypothetical protein
VCEQAGMVEVVVAALFAWSCLFQHCMLYVVCCKAEPAVTLLVFHATCASRCFICDLRQGHAQIMTQKCDKTKLLMTI